MVIWGEKQGEEGKDFGLAADSPVESAACVLCMCMNSLNERHSVSISRSFAMHCMAIVW